MFEVLVIRLLVSILDRLVYPNSAKIDSIEIGQRDEALMKAALKWAEEATKCQSPS